MPADDWALSQGTVDFRNEERMAGNGRDGTASALAALERARQAQQDHEQLHDVQLGFMLDLTRRCPVCGERADMCFKHGDDWKKQ